MTYSTIRDFVHDRSEAAGFGSGPNLKGVSIRLEPYRVEQLDLLASYLGFNSRQQVTSQLLATAIDDALHELSEALQGDHQQHARFIEDHLEILQTDVEDL
jgi:hypothetical protein